MRRFLAACLLALWAGLTPAQGILKPGAKDLCPVCGMLVSKYPNWVAVVQYRDGHAHFFDGAKDLFKYLHDLPKYAPGHRREGIGRDVDGGQERLPRRVDELAGGEPLAVGECDRVHEEMHLVEGLGVPGEGRVDVGVVAGVHRDQPGIGDAEFLDGAARAALVLVAGQVRERAAPAVLEDRLRDVPRVGTVVGDSDDQPGLSRQKRHARASLG